MNNDSDYSGVVATCIFGAFLLFVWWGSNTSSANTTSNSEYGDYSEIREGGYEDFQEDEYYEESNEFMGYECTDDCSGHEAGYDWAYENDVCDPEFSYGNSYSFDEGVQAYFYDAC